MSVISDKGQDGDITVFLQPFNTIRQRPWFTFLYRWVRRCQSPQSPDFQCHFWSGDGARPHCGSSRNNEQLGPATLWRSWKSPRGIYPLCYGRWWVGNHNPTWFLGEHRKSWPGRWNWWTRLCHPGRPQAQTPAHVKCPPPFRRTDWFYRSCGRGSKGTRKTDCLSQHLP